MDYFKFLKKQQEEKKLKKEKRLKAQEEKKLKEEEEKKKQTEKNIVKILTMFSQVRKIRICGKHRLVPTILPCQTFEKRTVKKLPDMCNTVVWGV